MAKVKDVTIVIKVKDGDIKKTTGKFKKLNTTVNNGSKEMTGSLNKMNSSLLKVGASLGGAFAIKAIVGDAAKRINAFEKSISSLSAITGATGKDLDKLKGIVLSTAQTTKKSATEIAKAFELVGSAQPSLLKNADALALVTKNAITLSKASGLDLTTAVNAVTTGMAQFNLSAGDSALVMDALAAGAKVGASAIPETSAAIEKFGAVANGANVSITDSVALIETLATKQLKGAEAGNNLKNVILKLKNAGLGFVDGQFDINAALEETKNKFDGIQDPVKRSQEQTKLFGLESATAGQILLDNIDVFEEFQGSVSESGVALTQAGIQMDNFAGRVEELDATYESFILSIEDGNGIFSQMGKGGAEAFTKILEAATDLNEFDFDKIFSPETAESQNRALKELSNTFLTLSGNLGHSKIIEEQLQHQTDQLTKAVSKLDETQLKSKEGAKVIVDQFRALGHTTEEAVEKYKELSGWTDKSTDTIVDNSDALDDNTTATDGNTVSKEKAAKAAEEGLKLRLLEAKTFRDLTTDLLIDGVQKELEIETNKWDDKIKIARIKFGEESEIIKLLEANKIAALEEIREVANQKEIDDEEKKDRTKKENKDKLQKEIDEENIINEEKKLAFEELISERREDINRRTAASAIELAMALISASGATQEAQTAVLVLTKLAAIGQIIVSTAKSNAITVAEGAALSIPTLGASVAAAAAIVVGTNVNAALNIATIAATAIPQIVSINQPKRLKDGEVLISGEGTETSDSIPAMLSKNESIINAKSSKKHTAALKAINDDRFDDWLNRVVMQKMYMGGEKEAAKVVINSDNSVKFPKSMRISNAKDISKDIIEAMSGNSIFNQGQGWD